jgi:hypothetical protein
VTALALGRAGGQAVEQEDEGDVAERVEEDAAEGDECGQAGATKALTVPATSRRTAAVAAALTRR